MGGIVVAALAALIAVAYHSGWARRQMAGGRPPEEIRSRLSGRLWITMVAVALVALAVAADAALPPLIVLSWGLPLAFVGFVVWAGVRIIRLLEDIKHDLRELSDRDRLP